MALPPPGFRYIDVHTHLRSEWLSAGIRRWSVGRPGWDLQYGTEPEWVARFLVFPELKVIVAHMGQLETRRHLELMERCPADATDADLVRWQDRILLGRAVPEMVHRKIFHDNAQRLLGL